MWRPKGWKNKILELMELTGAKKTDWVSTTNELLIELYEAGADDAIEALKKQGQYGMHHSEKFGGLGWVVFIPDETQDNKKQPV